MISLLTVLGRRHNENKAAKECKTTKTTELATIKPNKNYKLSDVFENILSTSKTQLTDFSSRNPTSQHLNNIMIGNADIGPALSANYLVLVIVCNANMIEHLCSKMSSKLSTCIFLLRRLSCFQSSNPPTVGLLLVFLSTS